MGLYSLGPFFPATAESISETPYSGIAWVTPGQVTADDGKCANITDAAYDANVKSYILKAYNFPGFTGVPTAATIVGIQSNFRGIWVAGTNPAKIGVGQLLTNQRVKGGTNQYAATPEDMSAGLTTHSKGGWNDLWGNALSAAWVRHSGFGVAYGVSAISNNTDISAQYISMSVWYSIPDSYTVTNNNGVIVVTPDSSYQKQTAAGGTAYTYSGTVEAEPTAKSYVTIHKVLNLEYGSLDVVSDSVYAYTPASAGTAHPYSGTIEADVTVESDRYKNLVRVGTVEADLDSTTVHSRGITYVGTVEGDVAVQASPRKGKSYAASVEAEAAVDSSLAKAKSKAGSVEATAAVDSDRAKSKSRAGSVEADVFTESERYKNIVRDGSVASDVESDSAYAYASGGTGPVAHPYVGTVEADAVVESDRYKQLVRDGSVEADADATTVHSRLKSYAGAVEGEVVAQATPAKSKSYTLSAEIDVALDSDRAKGKYKLGSVESEVVTESYRYKNIVRYGLSESKVVSDSAYALAASGGTAHPYVGTVEAIVVESSDRYRAKDYAGSVQGEFAVDSVRYKGKVYTGDLSTVIVLDSVYSKATEGAHVYVGTVEVTVQESSRIAVGKAYKSGANLVVVVGSTYAYSHPTAHPYEGCVYVTIGTGTWELFHHGLVEPARVTEPLPVTVWSSEGQPSDGYIQEPIPGYPGSQDGVWTMEGQDGAVTEPPAQGAYTDIGYYKEWKPWWQAYPQEAIPAVASIKEDKPTVGTGTIAVITVGAGIADGSSIADGSVIADGG